MRMKKDKSSHGFHGLLSFRNGVVEEICVIREIRGCYVETKVMFLEQYRLGLWRLVAMNSAVTGYGGEMSLGIGCNQAPGRLHG